MAKYQEKLRQVPLFQSLSRQELDILDRQIRHEIVKPGDYLIKQGELGSDVFWMLRGKAQVEIEVPGRSEPKPLTQLEEGQFVGEMALLGQERRSASVRALEEVEVLTWSKEDLESVFSYNLRIGYIVMRNLAFLLAHRLGATDVSLIGESGDQEQ